MNTTVSSTSELQTAETLLQLSESRFQNLFESSEVSLWDEDLSQVFEVLDRLKGRGVSNIRLFLKEHPEVLYELLSKTRVCHVNKATLKLFNARAEDEFLDCIDKSFGSRRSVY